MERKVRFWACLAIAVLLTVLAQVESSLSTWIWLVAMVLAGYAVYLGFRLDRR